MSTEKPYARCTTCGIDLPTPDDARQHSQDTMQPVHEPDQPWVTARGHGYRIENPTREEKIQSRVDSEIRSAVDRAMQDLDRLVDRDEATTEEITTALRGYGDFQDAWEEWIRG